ncbi:MAG: hypothetical protein JSS07_07575 [Proteobacteria bacterium]|nr:hypothetical protein [Pseudomonadota bacterium]
MKKTSITLWVPGLISPYLSHITEQGPLAWLLSRADKQSTSNSLEDNIKAYFSGLVDGIPSGALGALSQGLITINDRQTWCLIHPVECMVTHQAVFVSDVVSLQSAAHAQLIKTLSSFLNLDNLILHVINEALYCQVPHHTQVVMNDVFDVLHQNMVHYLPSGPSQAYWLRLVTECQMLLQSSIVNQERMKLNLPLVNIWFSGIGRLPNQLQTAFDRIYTNESTIQGLSLCAARSAEALETKPSKLFWQNCQDKHVLLADFNLYRNLKRQDVATWLQTVKHYESNWLMPLMMAIKNNDIQRLTLNFGQGNLFNITKRNLKYFWRKIRPLTYFEA